ncbi:cucumber peeling cupredoxin-like [Hevea brasiliensis]|uniref:cucumber peeling cupredoxin-like n=1 Tax=Hevea brasiliensis TaxID=3981 RepID=UPI0025D492C7|nr:cucumber peeling cupredoxin-like [Hevea brasiliensis]
MAMFIGVAFGFVVVVLLQCAAAQTVHVVGDNSGWTILQGGAQAYTEWANGKNFVVGDILTFNFETNEHDVLQVQKTSFDACSTSNPIGDVITTVPVNFTLDSAGDHYYICTFSQHCQLGQKLAITVSSSGGTPGASPLPSTSPRLSPPPTSPSPTNTPAICPPDAPAGAPTSPSTPGAMGPNTSPPPPGSSSSKLLAGISVSTLAVIMGFLF